MNASIPAKLTWDENSLDKAFAELEKECEEVVRGLTVETWNQMLRRTPQFFGRMVASYTYSLHYPVFVDRSEMVDQIESDDRDELASFAKSKGDLAAINIANNLNNYMPRRFRLGDTVWIANGVDHGEGPYSEMYGLGNQDRLRPVNRPGAPVTRTMDAIGSLYASVSKRQADYLKSVRIEGG